MSEERAIGLDGTSDAEVLFALVLDALDAGASPEEALAGVIADAAGRRADDRLNLLLSDGHVIVAHHLGELAVHPAGRRAWPPAACWWPPSPSTTTRLGRRCPNSSIVRASCADLDVSPLASHGGPP